MKSGLLKIGQLAKLAGVLPSTINFYTNLGLLTASDRSQGGYRLYHPAALQRIREIQNLQETRRLTIQEIQARFRIRRNSR